MAASTMNNVANFGARLHMGGEKIYDQYVAFTTKNNENVGRNVLGQHMKIPYLGNSSGYVYKLPLHTAHSRAGNRVSNHLNINKGIHLLSDIVKSGPPGVYIVATCREILGSSRAPAIHTARGGVGNNIANNNYKPFRLQNVRGYKPRNSSWNNN
jgi:hypothetical protein